MKILTIPICTGIGGRVLESLDQLVEGDGKEGAEQRPNPVDPMVPVECAENNVRTKRASWIERATSVEYTWKCQRGARGTKERKGLLTGQFGNEKRQSYSKGCEESRSMLLGCEHEDTEDELKRQEGLDKQASCYGSVTFQCGTYGQGARKQTRYDGGSCNSCKDLADDEEHCLEPANGTNKCQCYCHLPSC
jgi:hypothetical protein